MADKRISQLIERTDIANNDVLPIVASGATTTNKVTISTIQEWMQDNLDVGVTSVGITIGSSGTDINVTGSPVTTSGNITINIPTASATNRGLLSSSDWTSFNSKLSSVGLTMPSAFTVSNSPLTANGTIAVTGAGTVAQYIRGDGSLADFPEAGGGGASVSYYLNGSVSQGTIGGVAYLEMSKTPILGAGTNFTINANGYIASFITDAGDPNLLLIPGGNWNFETYFAASSGGGTPSFYVELYKVSGSTATLVASNSANPELIAFGTTTTAYFSSLAVPATTLTLTDRLALRYYVTHAGRTITLHTENSNLCQIITTFTTGLTALNGLTAQVQNFATGTSGTDFNISSSSATHTFNLPDASASNRGAVTTGTQTFAGYKIFNGTIGVNNDLQLATVGTALNTFIKNINSTGLTSIGSNGFGFNNANNIYFSGSSKGGGVFAFSNTGTQTYTLQDASGTLAFTSQIPTNPVGGTGTTNVLPKFTASSTIGDSAVSDNTNEVSVSKRLAISTSTSSFLLTPNLGGTTNRLETLGSLPLALVTAGSSITLAAGGTTPQITLASTGAVTLSNLAGTGTRMVVADSNGVLSSLSNPVTGTLATGQVAFGTAANTIGGDNGLFWDNTNKRLGIGANAPLGTLDIRVAGNGGSASNASNSIIISPLSISDITEGEIGSQIILNARRNGVSDGVSIASVMQTANFDLASMAFYTHTNSVGTPRVECMRIFGASGDVLLQNGGTFTDAGFRLDVNGTARVQGAATFSSSVTANGVMSLGNDGTFGTNYKTLGLTGNTTGTHRIFAGTSDDFFFAAATGRGFEFRANGGGVANLYIASSGNVGIGTASPSELLDIRGANRDQSSGQFNQVIYSTSSQDELRGGSIGFGGFYTGTSLSTTFSAIKGFKENGFGDNTAGALGFYSRPNGGAMTERMRITSGGSLLVGATSGTGIATGSSVNTGVDIGDGVISSQVNNNSNQYWSKASGFTSGDYTAHFVNGSYVGGISTNGSTTTYAVASDYRLKEDFQEINGLEKVQAIKVYDYKWKESEDRMDGVLAHELQEVLPYAVIGEKDAERMQSVDYSKIVPVLIKAIQELTEQVEALKSQING